MKIFILILLVITGASYSQSEKFLWVVNPKIGNISNETKLTSILTPIQKEESIHSVIVTGSITNDGSITNLKKARQIFNQFSNVYILPGQNEELASSLYGTRFTDEFENPNFSFLSDSTMILGMNNAHGYMRDEGYFSPENIGWLNDQLENASRNQNIIIFTNHASANTMNENQFISSFNDKKLVSIFSSDFTKDSYDKLHIATPSCYSSKNEAHELKVKIINISNNEISIIDIGLSKGNSTPKTYKQPQVPIKFSHDGELLKSSGADIIWSKDIQYSMIAEPLIYEDKIITADKSGLVSCLNISGKKLWDYDVFGDILCSPTAADGFLAVGTAQGDVSIINLKSGESLQTIGFDKAIITPLISFEYRGDKRLMVPKTNNSKAAVIVGTESGNLYCLDMQTLEEIWHTKIVAHPVLVKPILINNNLYFNSTDGYLYCLDSRDGTLVWKTKFEQTPTSEGAKCQLITDNQNIYFTTISGKVYSVNAKLGTVNWIKKYKAWQSIGISSNFKKLLVIGTDGRLNIIRPKNGRAYKIVVTNFNKIKLTTNPLFNHGIFFAASPKGKVFRISQKYSYKTILDLGDTPQHKIQKVNGRTYLASNFGGKIILFRLTAN